MQYWMYLDTVCWLVLLAFIFSPLVSECHINICCWQFFCCDKQLKKRWCYFVCLNRVWTTIITIYNNNNYNSCSIQYWCNLLISVPQVSVGHQHMIFRQRACQAFVAEIFAKQYWCFLIVDFQCVFHISPIMHLQSLQRWKLRFFFKLDVKM